MFIIGDTGDFRQLLDRIFANFQGHTFSLHQLDILPGQGIFRLSQDADEIFFTQRIKLNPDRETALHFRNQIGRFGPVKSSGRDEQNVVGFNDTVFGVN